MRILANIWHLIGRLYQPDGFLPLRAFKPSSSESADRGRSIIQVIKSADNRMRSNLQLLSVINVKIRPRYISALKKVVPDISRPKKYTT
jgi:hypothetical protein